MSDLPLALARIARIDPGETRRGWRTGLRDRAILVLLAVGLSSAEIARLQGRWVKRTGEGRLFVRLPGPPFKAFPVPSELQEPIEQWLDHSGARDRSALLFPGLAAATIRWIKRIR